MNPLINIEIKKITDNKNKSDYTAYILNLLPDWFEDRQAIDEYAAEVAHYSYWAVFDSNNIIGFFSIKIHYEVTAEIYVCGIDPRYHNKGIGTKVYRTIEEYLKSIGCIYIIVKTLSDIVNSKHYDKTRAFYKNIGFMPLITLTEIWDEENPCLIMIKNIQAT